MAETLTVFLSSTSADLQEARQKLYDELNRRRGIKAISMDHNFPASTKTPQQLSQEAANECDLFIGIFGTLYGSEVPGTKISYTRLEYETALNAKKDRLIFRAKGYPVDNTIREGDEKNKKLVAFQKYVTETGGTYKNFDSDESLIREVVLALEVWQREHTTPQVTPQSSASSGATPQPAPATQAAAVPLASTPSPQTNPNKIPSLMRLIRFLREKLSPTELQDIANDYGTPTGRQNLFDRLRGTSHDERISELVYDAERRDALPELMAAIEEARPGLLDKLDG